MMKEPDTSKWDDLLEKAAAQCRYCGEGLEPETPLKNGLPMCGVYMHNIRGSWVPCEAEELHQEIERLLDEAGML